MTFDPVINYELNEKEKLTYNLNSVIVHSGGVHGGHYYCFIQDLKSKTWTRFNDEEVKSVSAYTFLPTLNST